MNFNVMSVLGVEFEIPPKGTVLGCSWYHRLNVRKPEVPSQEIWT